MLKGIINNARVTKLNNNFKSALKKFKSGTVTTQIGYKGNSWLHEVEYSNELGIWWTFRIANNKKRYWNAFGIGKPDRQTNIITEINYPIEGIDFRVAACWGEDAIGGIYLLHSGKIGGGKKEIGMTTF